MKVFYLIPLVFSFSLYASDSCKSIDLSAEGNVLHPLRVTHQNGLGICHIEQLHKLLKAKMPGNPDLARISLAIAEKKNRDKNKSSTAKKAVRWMDKDGLPGGTYIDAGDACTAYNLVKDEEICESSADQFENFTKKDAHNQKKIIDALSMYFDGKSKTLTLDSTGDLQNKIVSDYETLSKSCPIDRAASILFSMSYLSAGGDIPDGTNYSAINASLYLVASNGEDYLNTLAPKMKGLLETNADLKEAKKIYLEALKNQENCINDLYKITDKTNLLSCQELDTNTSRVFSLNSLGFKLKDLHRIVDMTKSDRDDFFANAASCEGKKIKIPTNLKCFQPFLISTFKAAKDFDAHSKKTAELVSEALEDNTPVGISICTRFFKNPEVKTLKDDATYPCGEKTDPEYQDGEGSHAVTLIGQRCNKDGKKEFLLQNSWGSSCAYYSKSYECTGKGGIWVNQDVLFRNSRSLSILK